MIPVAKSLSVGVALAAVLAVAGFSVAEVGEYLSVARNRVSTAVRGEIPLSVEIDRMEVLLGKLDSQVSQQKFGVARSKVALQDAETEFARAQSSCRGLVDDMQQLRSLSMAGTTSSCGTITVGVQKVSAEDVSRALAHKLAAWKTASETCTAREEALKQQQKAFAALEQQFGEWQSRRQLLAQRLETLKARHQAQTLASETNTSVFNNADLARTTELADRIEREIRVVEAQQALGTDPTESLLTTTPSIDSTSSVEAEVDRILGQKLTEN